MRYPFDSWQADFRKLVNSIETRNKLYKDAKECADEGAHEEAKFLLGMAEAAEAGAKSMAEELI